jgi:diadenosine tetraphosphate (Ap4A) HIT family hydrolase
MDCFYCTKDERQQALMTPLAELEWSDIYLFKDQKHKGRCIVALKGHSDEIWQLSEEQRSGFFGEVSLVAEAMARYTKADKVNYAIYGDIVSHFHVHLVPKLKDGLQWGGPFTDTLPKVILEEGEFLSVGQSILKEMDAIAQEKGLPAAKHLM